MEDTAPALWQDIYASIAYSLATAELESKPQSDAIRNATDSIYSKLAETYNACLDEVVRLLEKRIGIHKQYINESQFCINRGDPKEPHESCIKHLEDLIQENEELLETINSLRK